MKKLLVSGPISMGILLLISFIAARENEGIKHLTNEAESFPRADIARTQANEPYAKDSTFNLTKPQHVYRSMDGGETWQDISVGLPGEGTTENSFYADEKGFYIRIGNAIYQNEPNATAIVWKKENFTGNQGSISRGKTGIFAYDYAAGQFVKKINGTDIWSPVYTNFQEKQVRNVFDTAKGSVLISSDKGIFKSVDRGKTWKQVDAGSWVMKMAESGDVLVAASQRGIIRSTDDGENWEVVISEGGVGIDVESIQHGFAAITYNTDSETRRVRISYDGGKTWQPIDAGLTPDPYISSIIQVGEHFFCGHPNGIFRSSDKGKTWKLLLPSVRDKVFNLCASGNVIYAVLRTKGC